MIWTVLAVISAVIIFAWCFWRINQTPAHGEWPLKIILVALAFGAAFTAAETAVNGNWDWAEAVLLAALASYCIWGWQRDRRLNHSRLAMPTVGRTGELT